MQMASAFDRQLLGNQVVVNQTQLGNAAGYVLAGSFALGTLGYLLADRLAVLLPSPPGAASSRADQCRCDVTTSGVGTKR